jgi:hypothetical protein
MNGNRSGALHAGRRSDQKFRHATARSQPTAAAALVSSTSTLGRRKVSATSWCESRGEVFHWAHSLGGCAAFGCSKLLAHSNETGEFTERHIFVTHRKTWGAAHRGPSIRCLRLMMLTVASGCRSRGVYYSAAGARGLCGLGYGCCSGEVADTGAGLRQSPMGSKESYVAAATNGGAPPCTVLQYSYDLDLARPRHGEDGQRDRVAAGGAAACSAHTRTGAWQSRLVIAGASGERARRRREKKNGTIESWTILIYM